MQDRFVQSGQPNQAAPGTMRLDFDRYIPIAEITQRDARPAGTVVIERRKNAGDNSLLIRGMQSCSQQDQWKNAEHHLTFRLIWSETPRQIEWLPGPAAYAPRPETPGAARKSLGGRPSCGAAQ